MDIRSYFGLMVRGLAFLIGITVPVLAICTFVLAIKALLKYLKSAEVREEKSSIKQSLGEVLRRHREGCKMTQEFVAEKIGVSRQAVSKWENGISDPSTSNLLSLAKLFGIPPEELLSELE